MKKSTKNKKEVLPAGDEQLINRKQAIKKTGYIALSAATMMMLFNTNAHAVSTATPAKPNSTPPKPGGVWND